MFTNEKNELKNTEKLYDSVSLTEISKYHSVLFSSITYYNYHIGKEYEPGTFHLVYLLVDALVHSNH